MCLDDRQMTVVGLSFFVGVVAMGVVGYQYMMSHYSRAFVIKQEAEKQKRFDSLSFQSFHWLTCFPVVDGSPPRKSSVDNGTHEQHTDEAFKTNMITLIDTVRPPLSEDIRHHLHSNHKSPPHTTRRACSTVAGPSRPERAQRVLYFDEPTVEYGPIRNVESIHSHKTFIPSLVECPDSEALYNAL
eukprot:PhF_6_TR861/c0_g1_i1/m.1298